jgi:hypothetical protein
MGVGERGTPLSFVEDNTSLLQLFPAHARNTPLSARSAAPLWQAAQAQAMKALEAATPSRISSAILFVRSYRKSRKADNCRDQRRQDIGQHWVTP